MTNQCTDEELERLIQDANESAQGGRLERLRTLLSEGESDPTPFDALAYQYYEEARLCWYVGAFVAAITMSQLAFEEMLRSRYRVTKGVGGNLNEHKKVDNSGFADLINQAEDDGWLSPEEAAALHKVRKEYRNPYLHTHDWDESKGLSKPNFFLQHMKITAPELFGIGAEDEARHAIKLLVTLLPKVSRRLWGTQ